jgi:GT2 family glycosyltransferase
MSEIKISGSIVVYKQNYDVLKAAVESFLSTNLNVLLFIIDNSPSDELKKITGVDVNCIRYVFTGANLGYGTAHNIAIREALALNSFCHLVFNADTFFEGNVLQALYDFMNLWPRVGHVMPKVLYPDGRLQRLCRTAPRFKSLFARRFLPFFMHNWFRESLNKTEYGDESYDEVMYNIPFLSGCFMFFRTQSLKEVGLFDERFFLYLEDADITRRILSRYDNAYYPHASVYHYYKKGSYKSLRLTLHHIKSAFYYFRKWGW